MAETVSTGKTHSRYARFLADGYNLSGSARSLGQGGIVHTEAPMSGWSADLNEFGHGRGAVMMGPFQAVFDKDDEAGSYDALSGNDAAVVSLVLGIGEAPTIGAPAFSADVEQFEDTVTVSDDSPVILNADFSAAVAGEAGWGQMLAIGASISSSTDLGSLDGGASSSDGFIAVLHVVTSEGAMGSNDFTLQLEDSANDSDWANLGSAFSLDGSAIGAEVITGTGTVRQYVRLSITKTAGTDIKCWLNFIRL